jgi:predicted AlkP superfamily phosphohydrolase/phosphomutase
MSDTTTKSPIIIIVLESAEQLLIDRWSHEGLLPTLDKLRQNGVWGKMASPGYISSGCVWASFTCGVNPGKHGFGFFHRQHKSGTYRTIKKYADDLHYDHLWLTASRNGKKVAVLDVPLTKPEADLNGYFFCRWGDEHPSWKPSSIPEGLLGVIIEQFGRHPLDEWYQTRLESPAEWSRWKNALSAGVKKRTAITKHILGKEAFDLLVVNYAEPHWAGHIAWHLHDSNHPEFDAELVSQCGDIILSNYQDLDNAIAEIMDCIPDARFIITSPIGMGSNTGGEIMTPAILGRLGINNHAQTRQRRKSIVRSLLPGKDGLSRAVQQIERFIAPATIAYVKKFIPERLWDDWTRRLLALGTDWKYSRVFVVPGDNASLLRINLKGREPHGLVTPGEEYEQLCQELIEAFYELTEVATGAPAVQKIVRLRDVLWGENLDELPDIVVVWRPGLPIEAVESPRIGRVELPEYHKRTGGHSEYGFLLASGPGIRENVVLEDIDLLDFAPTVLTMLGVDAPAFMDGKTMDRLFKTAVPAIPAAPD